MESSIRQQKRCNRKQLGCFFSSELVRRMGYQRDAPCLISRSTGRQMRRTKVHRLPFLRLPPLMTAPESLTNFLSVPDSLSSRIRSAVETSIRTPSTSKIGNDRDPVRRWKTGSRVSTSTRSLTSITMGVGRRLKESMRERSSRETAEGFPITLIDCCLVMN